MQACSPDDARGWTLPHNVEQGRKRMKVNECANRLHFDPFSLYFPIFSLYFPILSVFTTPKIKKKRGCLSIFTDFHLLAITCALICCVCKFSVSRQLFILMQTLLPLLLFCFCFTLSLISQSQKINIYIDQKPLGLSHCRGKLSHPLNQSRDQKQSAVHCVRQYQLLIVFVFPFGFPTQSFVFCHHHHHHTFHRP